MTDQQVHPTERSRAAAADHFRLVGELEARVAAHDSQLATMDERLRTYDSRAQQLQAQIARLAGVSESTLEGLNKVERMREEDHRELRTALIEALKAAPRANRTGSALGMLLAALALVVLALVMTGSMR